MLAFPSAPQNRPGVAARIAFASLGVREATNAGPRNAGPKAAHRVREKTDIAARRKRARGMEHVRLDAKDFGAMAPGQAAALQQARG